MDTQLKGRAVDLRCPMRWQGKWECPTVACGCDSADESQSGGPVLQRSRARDNFWQPPEKVAASVAWRVLSECAPSIAQIGAQRDFGTDNHLCCSQADSRARWAQTYIRIVPCTGCCSTSTLTPQKPIPVLSRLAARRFCMIFFKCGVCVCVCLRYRLCSYFTAQKHIGKIKCYSYDTATSGAI